MTSRPCIFCGGEVTSTKADVDFCQFCFYSGQAFTSHRAEQLAKFERLVPGAEVRVEHTGGGCFWLAFRFEGEPTYYVATDGEASLPADPETHAPILDGWGYVGRYNDDDSPENPDYEGTIIAEPTELSEHDWAAYTSHYPANALTDDQVVVAILADRAARVTA